MKVIDKVEKLSSHLAKEAADFNFRLRMFDRD